MILLFCQKQLLQTEAAIEDNGKKTLDFTCQKTGLHFRLDPKENRTRSDKADSLCRLCDKHCPVLNKK